MCRKAFVEVVRGRRSARRFAVDVACDGLMRDAKEALGLAQRAPSGFNLQPYRAVLVQDPLVKAQLARTMVGGNIERVLRAPVTVVWLADLQPWKLIQEVVAMERERGGFSELELRNLAADAHFLLGGLPPAGTGGEGSTSTQQSRDALSSVLGAAAPDFSKVNQASHSVEMSAKKVFLDLLSEVTQAPTINSSSEAWSFKNTMMAVQTYLLAMDAFGWDSCAMEGFDARRIKKVISAPDERYSVPIVVSSGVREDFAGKPPLQERPRLDFEQVFSMDSLDFPLYKHDEDSV